ncbi:MAG: hypothetical protein WD336_03190 [Trueperaceae bacterium]
MTSRSDANEGNRTAPGGRWAKFAALRDRRFLLRLPQYLAGLVALAAGLAVMLDAGVGVGPWAVFHEGIAVRTPLTFGTALIVVGIVVQAFAWAAGERPGPGTFLNMVLVGPVVDLFLFSGWVPVQTSLLPGLLQALLGVLLVGFGSGLYITARFGAGPRDGFVLAASRVTGASVRRTRTVLEVVVLLIGALLGGTVGIGTALFALLIGPAMQTAIRLFSRAPVRGATAGD